MSTVLAPSTPPPVAARPGPQPFRWTIEQYRELGKLDVFQGVRTMLIDGEIYTMVMPNPPHDTALALTEEWLRTAFPTGHHVRTQKGFNIGTRNDPGPDLAVVPGSIRDYATQTPTTAVLIVEVTETSLFTDTTTKAELYATAGVPDYWVIDLENRRLLVYRDPEPLPAGLGATAYRNHLAFSPADSVSPLAAPHSSIAVADLLP
ncbi:MAG TPA: Uma2 family endonuclease [Fimbriiglobus sp.]|nr:Uma2 family endonuclease [Fimbriiglobus sp.]